MIQIGIHNTGYTTSAALFVDGKLVYASPEERLSRVKFDNEFPWRAITEGLDKCGLTLDDVDQFLFGWNSFINAAGRTRPGFSRWVSHPMGRLYSNVNQILPRLAGSNVSTSEQRINLGRRDVTLTFVDHHLCHLGTSWNTSPFDQAAVFIADGYGEASTTITGRTDTYGTFHELSRVEFPHSLGMFYAAFTEYLGFCPEKDEWKMMGASAYGYAERYYDQIRRLIQVNGDASFEIDLNYFNFFNFDRPGFFNAKFVGLLGPPRTNDELNQRHYDIAAAAQKVLEDVVFQLLGTLASQVETTNLCVGGGVAMNTLLNGKISRNTPFEKIYVPFSPDDTGNAIGVVLHFNNSRTGHMMPYYGSGYSDPQIEAALRLYGIPFQRFDRDKLLSTVTGALCEGKIVAWFQGNMEFGQRALGNRSILADPCTSEMKDRINAAVKFRETFRPFAPAIVDDAGCEFFEQYAYSPYMERVCSFKSNVVDKVPAVVHEDGTGRVQSVIRTDNPLYYDLIKVYGERKGCPVVLNTSFNRAGEPIVRTPEDAIRTFFTSGLDELVLGSYVIKKG